MAVHQEPRLNTAMQVPAVEAAQTAPQHGAVMTPVAAKAAALVRIATGFVFLWAFLDKTFGWTTPPPPEGLDRRRLADQGLPRGVAVGPLESIFHDIAGEAWADWLFMLGCSASASRSSAAWPCASPPSGAPSMMALMWAAEWPPAQHLSTGRRACRRTRSSTTTSSTPWS